MLARQKTSGGRHCTGDNRFHVHDAGDLPDSYVRADRATTLSFCFRGLPVGASGFRLPWDATLLPVPDAKLPGRFCRGLLLGWHRRDSRVPDLHDCRFLPSIRTRRSDISTIPICCWKGKIAPEKARCSFRGSIVWQFQNQLRNLNVLEWFLFGQLPVWLLRIRDIRFCAVSAGGCWFSICIHIRSISSSQF